MSKKDELKSALEETYKALRGVGEVINDRMERAVRGYLNANCRRHTDLSVQTERIGRVVVSAPYVRKDGTIDNSWYYCTVDYCNRTLSSERRIRLDPMGHCGSMDTSNEAYRTILSAQGALAEGLDELEKTISEFEWNVYDRLDADHYKARSELEKFEREEREEEQRRERESCLSHITVGAKFFVGREFHEAKPEVTAGVIRIVGVGDKIVRFVDCETNSIHRMKKDEMINEIKEARLIPGFGKEVA